MEHGHFKIPFQEFIVEGRDAAMIDHGVEMLLGATTCGLPELFANEALSIKSASFSA